MGFLIFFLTLGIIIFIFSSKTFSPIPYFPSQKVDLPLIVKALNLKNDQVVIDLGAGDGIVIFEAARMASQKKLNTKFIAVEINPVLILVLHLRRLFHPNRKNIKIILDDMFKMNFNRLTRKPVNSLIFYLYISPWYMDKTISNIKRQTNKFKVVSYMYPLSIKTTKSSFSKATAIRGKNQIFVYLQAITTSRYTTSEVVRGAQKQSTGKQFL